MYPDLALTVDPFGTDSSTPTVLNDYPVSDNPAGYSASIPDPGALPAGSSNGGGWLGTAQQTLSSLLNFSLQQDQLKAQQTLAQQQAAIGVRQNWLGSSLLPANAAGQPANQRDLIILAIVGVGLFIAAKHFG